jgi:hypothetical protein
MNIRITTVSFGIMRQHTAVTPLPDGSVSTCILYTNKGTETCSSELSPEAKSGLRS